MRLLILLLFLSSSWANEGQTFDHRQYEKILKEFRCVTCPNQNIADSQAPVAQAMREEIHQRLQKGESVEEIKVYLVERFGDYVLYRPPVKKQTWFLWVAPFILLVGVGIGWVRVVRMSTK